MYFVGLVVVVVVVVVFCWVEARMDRMVVVVCLFVAVGVANLRRSTATFSEH